MSPDYFRGLNHLLNDRPDKAIEVFLKVLEVETETVETHLALGNLFRRRGEVDRAIRIHQNLIARPALEFDQRAAALLELGLDYMRSGLLDRAESLFKELLESGAHQRQAIDHLVDIYQQERDWDKALEYTGRLEKFGQRDLSQRRAHFLCEQAEALLAEGDVEEASARLREALRVKPKCVRASLMQARLAMTAGAYEGAIRHLRQVEEQDLAFLPEAIGPLVECYRALAREAELIAYLHELCTRHAGTTAVLALAEILAARGQPDAAKQRLVEELKHRPTVRGIDRLIDYSLVGAAGETLQNLELLKELTTSLLERKANYQCGNCGFKGRSLHWQCPSCKSWSTVKPIHGVEGE
jgi:lipopolysaccharide biosynthesis regulator YciM